MLATIKSTTKAPAIQSWRETSIAADSFAERRELANRLRHEEEAKPARWAAAEQAFAAAKAALRDARAQRASGDTRVDVARFRVALEEAEDALERLKDEPPQATTLEHFDRVVLPERLRAAVVTQAEQVANTYRQLLPQAIVAFKKFEAINEEIRKLDDLASTDFDHNHPVSAQVAAPHHGLAMRIPQHVTGDWKIALRRAGHEL
jgi:hypothetical protein